MSRHAHCAAAGTDTDRHGRTRTDSGGEGRRYRPAVIPAKAGIQGGGACGLAGFLDSRLRGNDGGMAGGGAALRRRRIVAGTSAAAERRPTARDILSLPRAQKPEAERPASTEDRGSERRGRARRPILRKTRFASACLFSLLAVAALVLCGCEPQYKFSIVDEEYAPLLQIDRYGNIEPYAPIIAEANTGELTASPSSHEFMVRRSDGAVVLRADGTERAIYLKGELMHVADLAASSAPEFVVRDPAGVAQAIVDTSGNLKYRGSVVMGLVRAVSAAEYRPCGTLDVTLHLYYYDEEELSALGIQEILPAGWTFLEMLSSGEGEGEGGEGEGADQSPDLEPEAGDNPVEFAWVNPPGFPLTLRYRVTVPWNAQGEQEIIGRAYYRTDGAELMSPIIVTDLSQGSPEGECEGEGEGGARESGGGRESEGEGKGGLRDGGEGEGEGGLRDGGEGEGEGCGPVSSDCDFHSADTIPAGAPDRVINLTELLRLIQFFNLDGYHCSCDPESEDGYAPGSGNQDCVRHDADYQDPAWVIDLSELLRLIQFFNLGGYLGCPSCNLKNDEDGFIPAPALDLVGSLDQYMCANEESFPNYSGWYTQKLGVSGNIPAGYQFALLEKILFAFNQYEHEGLESIFTTWCSYFNPNIEEDYEAQYLASLLTLGTYLHDSLGPGGDLDGDEHSNIAEWRYLSIYIHEPEELKEAYAEWALDETKDPTDGLICPASNTYEAIVLNDTYLPPCDE